MPSQGGNAAKPQQKMLSFGGGGMFRTYSSDDAPGIPIGPKGVAFLSLGFLGVVIILHVIGKLF